VTARRPGSASPIAGGQTDQEKVFPAKIAGALTGATALDAGADDIEVVSGDRETV